MKVMIEAVVEHVLSQQRAEHELRTQAKPACVQRDREGQ